MVKFYEEGPKIAWDSNFYTPEISEQWRNYSDMARDLKHPKYKRKFDQVELAAYDTIRSALHNNLAESLVAEEIAPTKKIGKKLLKLMLVTRGLETIEDASVNSFDQTRASLGGNV